MLHMNVGLKSCTVSESGIYMRRRNIYNYINCVIPISRVYRGTIRAPGGQQSSSSCANAEPSSTTRHQLAMTKQIAVEVISDIS